MTSLRAMSRELRARCRRSKVHVCCLFLWQLMPQTYTTPAPLGRRLRCLYKFLRLFGIGCYFLALRRCDAAVGAVACVDYGAVHAVLRASPLTSLPQRCDLYLRQLTASGAMPLLTDNISDSERPCPHATALTGRCQPAMLDRWTPVFEPRQQHPWVSRRWTNNAAESMNHLLKLSIDWHPRRLPELVDRLYKVTSVQMSDLRRALYGHGNYTLTAPYNKFSLPHTSWQSKSPEVYIFLNNITLVSVSM